MVVKRTHTAANVAPAVRTLLDQVNAAYPNRLKTTEGHDSDGIWPSESHTAENPNSDHEAGNALDIDDDLSGADGTPPQVTPEFARRLSLHPANDYTIHDRVLYRDGIGRAYTGTNPHTGHVHVSVLEDRRNNTQLWDIGTKEEPVMDCLFIIVTGSAANLRTVKAHADAANLWAGEVTPGEMWVHCRTSRSAPFLAKLASYRAFRGDRVKTVPTYSGSFRDIKTIE